MSTPPSVPQARRVFSQRLLQLVGVLRMFMRDYPELNRLIEGVESDNRFLAWAIMDTIADYNETPPWVTQYTVDTFPYPHMLIRGAAASVLQSVGLLQSRNHLTFSDGGMQVGISDKSQLVMAWSQMFTASYEGKKTRTKVAENIEMGWGEGIHSDYWYVNGVYGYF